MRRMPLRMVGSCASLPTPPFIRSRVDLAKDLHVAGVALWEIGQMVPMMIDGLTSGED